MKDYSEKIYGDGLGDIIFGKSSAKAASERCENKDFSDRKIYGVETLTPEELDKLLENFYKKLEDLEKPEEADIPATIVLICF